MSRAIFKYEIPIDDEWHEFMMPTPARIVHVARGHSGSAVYAWAEVTPTSTEAVIQRLRVFGTGHRIPDGASYIGTAPADPFVWHVYADANK